MWMDKLSDGVLRVLTPLGPRYIKPRFAQRLYLTWIFRHFESLPQQVLSRRQQQLVDNLCHSHNFVSLLQGNGFEEVPVIGTVERWQPTVLEELPASSSAVRVAERARTALADQQGS
ncbi:MAG: hypothetical protein DMG68_15255 [Acidobacteria bacterium]|jgi:hypothetical protein|nr:MAG: hypothetical protein DMG68_15255 [Acidobacteriota bacterium]